MSDPSKEAIEAAVRKKIRRPVFATLAGDHVRGIWSATSTFVVSGAMLLPIRELLGLRPAAESKERQVTTEGRDVRLMFHDLRAYLDKVAHLSNTRILEELHSPYVVIAAPEHEQLKRVARGFINRHCYHDFLERAESHRQHLGDSGKLAAIHLLEAARLYMVGIHLLTTGTIESNLQELCERYEALWIKPFVMRQRLQGDAAHLDPEEVRLVRYDLERLEAQLHEAHERSSLPEAGGSISSLDEFLVDVRLRDIRESG